jgi:polyphosphate kinase
VLAQVEDESLPLLERARFLAIASRALDEFFQVRVGGLKQLAAGLESAASDPHGPQAQIRAIRLKVVELYARQARAFLHGLVPHLDSHGIRFSDWSSLDEDDRAYLDKVFEERIFPVLTPLAVDPGHPFPYISSPRATSSGSPGSRCPRCSAGSWCSPTGSDSCPSSRSSQPTSTLSSRG